MILRALLLLAPALVAALGGFLAVRVRRSPFWARTVQLGMALTLIGSALASYFSELPALFWIVQLVLALPCCVLFLANRPFLAKLTTKIISPRRWDLALLAASPLLLACALWQVSIMTAPDIFALEESEAPLLTHQAADTAYTDRGRQIRLFELKPESKDSFSLTGDTGLLVSGTPTPYRAIRLTEPDGTSNCVGWVFTGAHHLMQGIDVDSILEDNSYQAVKEPRVGDLVVYRNDERLVTHRWVRRGTPEWGAAVDQK